MADQITHRDDESGLTFVAVMVSGMILVSALLLIAVALFGHFSYPDPGLF